MNNLDKRVYSSVYSLKPFLSFLTLLLYLSPIPLVFYLTLNFHPENILFLAIVLTVYASATATPGIMIALYHRNELSSMDIALAGIFSALIYVSNYALILLPTIIFYIVPFSAGLTFYLPTSIVFGAYVKVAKPNGSIFNLLLVYGIISIILSPSIFWFPYYIAWGGLLETGRYLERISGGEESIILGYGYGSVGAGLSVSYMLIAWGYYRPLFMTIPSIIVDGILSLIGYRMGRNIGERLLNIRL